MAAVGLRLRIQGFMDFTCFCISRLTTDGNLVEIWKSWANNIFLEIIIIANLLVLLFYLVIEKLKTSHKIY